MSRVNAKNLGRNSFFAFFEQGWRIGTRLIITPLIITLIGMDGYGTWALLFAITAYINLTEVSFGMAYSKYTAEYDTREDYKTLSHIIGSGIALVGTIAMIGLAILWFIKDPVLRLLNVPPAAHDDASLALMIVAACLAIRMSVGCVFQILAGLQRIDLQYKTKIMVTTIEVTVQLVLLYYGWGLVGLAVGHAVSQIAGTFVAWLFCRSLVPELRIGPWHMSLDGFRLIGVLGGRFQILSVLSFLAVEGSKLVISALAGVTVLGIFDVARKLLDLGMVVGSAITAPLMPAFANLHAEESHDRLKLLYLYGSRAVSAICIPTFAFLALFADELILLWVGKPGPDDPWTIGQAAWTVRVLVAASCATLLTGVITSHLRGRGLVRMEMNYAILGVLVFFGCVFPGYWLGGYEGIIYSFLISSLTGAAWLIVNFSYKESIPLKPYVRDILLRPLLVLGPVIAAIGLLEWRFAFHIPYFKPDSRPGALIDLLPWMAFYGLAVILAGWFGLLTQDERNVIRGKVAGTLKKSPPLEVQGQS